VQIKFEGKGTLNTGENTDGKVAEFRRDETPAGIARSFHKDHARIAEELMPEPRSGGQSTKRDEETTRTIPRFVIAEQWLCFLLGLICMICGVYGLFMKYSKDVLFAYARWLGPAYGPTLRFIAVVCFVLGAVLVRLGLARPARISISSTRKALRSVRRHPAPDTNAVPVKRASLDNKRKLRGKKQHERRSG
jgi:hypothetical protein